jgi:Calcineurin-like phosphoesterase
MLTTRCLHAAAVLAVLAGGAGFAMAQDASLTTSGYSENFDSMGTSGTVAPTGWRHFVTSFGSNTTWATSIPASGTNSMASQAVTTAATALVASSNPTANQNAGYNAARTAGTTADRVITTAPSGPAGSIVQLQIANNTGGTLLAGTQLTIAFDTVRHTAAGSANELPGHWVFISLDGTTWTNIGPNPTITTVPNTIGVTSTTLTHTLATTWNSGSVAYFRFVDDNALQSSPDQVTGLNNVVITYAAGNPNGRCCFPDGSCVAVTDGVCAVGGLLTPSGVCTPNTCPQPPQGSCCAEDGSCTVTIQTNCASPAAWTNAGVCSPNTCPVRIASLVLAGYNENFDALGQTGTTLPVGYSTWTVPGDRPTFEEPAIPASGVSGGTQVSPPGTLAAYTQTGTNTPPTRNAGYNFGFSSDPANRMLGISPTSVGAAFIQLRLRNDTGAPVSTLTVNYTFRVMSPWQGNELAGFRFFYSTTGPAGTYAAEPALDGVATSENSAGDSSNQSAVISLASPLAPNAEIVIRWADDNGNTSPDQSYAIDNISIIANATNIVVCCLADGTCLLLPDTTPCGGTILPLATSCNPNPCPQPPSGACCALDGNCTFVRQSSCTGTWTINVACTPNPCPGPVVACCLPDGSCLQLPQEQCTAGFNAGAVACTTVALCRPAGSTRFVAFGDHGVDNTNQNAVADRMKRYNPEFMVTTGDNTYFTGTGVDNYDRTQTKYYGEFIKVTNPASIYFAQFGNNVNRFYPCMGNHDFDIGGGAGAAIPYWNAYFELPGNERYYTFSKGPIDFFVLSSDSREPDSNTATGTQANWFNAAYAASSAKFKIVVFHHPPYTNPTTHANNATMQAWNFQDLPGVTAVMNGHNHNMQRLELPRGGAGVGTGAGTTVPHFISGAGGNSLYSITGTSPFNAFFNATDFGFLLVDVLDGSATFRFINAAGNVIDSRVATLPGACCAAGGVCTLSADVAGCTGTFQGAGTMCMPSTCPQPGACCNGTACTVAVQSACTGTFRGPGTVCNPLGNANPTTCCPANFNQVDGLSVQDIFAFLAAWFNGDIAADFDQSGALAVADIFAFLAAWFAGC